MDIPILFQDDDLVIVNKPAGVIVNRANTVREETIQDWIDKNLKLQNSNLKEEEKDFRLRSGLVHRIDKETSGCLIIAKNPQSFFKLQTAFKERLIKKEYVALVHGKLTPNVGEVNAPVGRLPWNRQHFGVVPGGKEAHTHYSVERYYSDNLGNNYTLARLAPTTGRTHQIRVHMKYLGFPLVGDYLYAGRKQQDKDRTWCPRVFLHAAKITFPLLQSSEMKTISAPLPLDLNNVLNSLIPI